MDPALRLLLLLRVRGWLRRVGRSLATVKGALLTAAGLCLFAPQVLAAVVTPRLGAIVPGHLERVRRFGTLGLFAFCLLTVLLSSGERAIYFSPAEVNFLFPGPFRRRQVLAYKLAGQLLGVAIVAMFMTAALSPNSARLSAAFVGLLLALVFFQLVSVAVALVANTVGALAYSRGRRLLLAALAALILASLLPVGREAFHLEPRALLARVEQTGVVQAVLSPWDPLRWFVEAFTAERLWPDLLMWAGLGLAVDAALLALVFALDANYLETAAATSARIYARIERMRRGGVAPVLGGSGRKRNGLPMLPWWGGAGPTAWRQLTTARRDFARLLVVLLVLGSYPLVPAFFRGPRDPQGLLALEGIIIGMTIVLTPLVPFDFRVDVERMAELKALPLRASRLALGQLIAPVVLMTALQAMALGLLMLCLGAGGALFWAIAAFALPSNALLFGVENLWCLLFPTRWAPSAGFDPQVLGRNVLLAFAKIATMALAAGLAAALGGIVYLVSGSLWATLSTAWVALAGSAAGLIPVLALAFRQFDVARDTPGND